MLQRRFNENFCCSYLPHGQHKYHKYAILSLIMGCIWTVLKVKKWSLEFELKVWTRKDPCFYFLILLFWIPLLNKHFWCFQFREQVQKMMKIPCSKEEKKKGLENCHKSQSFFNGINLMQVPVPGGDKTQTLSTNMADSQSRVSYFFYHTNKDKRRIKSLSLFEFLFELVTFHSWKKL